VRREESCKHFLSVSNKSFVRVGLGPRGVFDGAGAAPFKSPSVGKTQLVRCAQIPSLPGSFFAGGSEEPR
jgi:hypothetical protein